MAAAVQRHGPERFIVDGSEPAGAAVWWKAARWSRNGRHFHVGERRQDVPTDRIAGSHRRRRRAERREYPAIRRGVCFGHLRIGSSLAPAGGYNTLGVTRMKTVQAIVILLLSIVPGAYAAEKDLAGVFV